MKSIRNKAACCVFFLFVFTTKSHGEEIDRDSFLLKNNEVFLSRLNAFECLLATVQSENQVAERVKKIILQEIENISDWLDGDFSMIVLPIGSDKQIHPFPLGEHRSKLKGTLTMMRVAMEGFDRDLPSNSTLKDRLRVVSKLTHTLDKQLASIAHGDFKHEFGRDDEKKGIEKKETDKLLSPE